jgi:uncharacterized protein VirK/YbjX
MWSPFRLARVLWGAFSHIGTQRKIFQILKRPPYAEAVRRNPRLPFKYLAINYLVRGFTLVERGACLLHHYRRFHALLPSNLLSRILQGNVTLHDIHEDGQHFAISMGLSMPWDKEGEISLNLEVNGEIVFLLSFTIVPGWVVQSEAGEVLLISRIQGTKGCYREIQLATKAMYDVAPSPLLLAALQGVANAFGIREFAGVSAARQSGPDYEEHTASLEQAYDSFFSQLGIAPNAAGFYLSSISVEDKPLASIKQGHKLRTRQRRAFKRDIQMACAAYFEEFVQVSSRELPA